MKKRIIKKVRKNMFQYYIALLIQTAVFNPSVIGVLEEDSMHFLLNLLERRWPEVKECLPTSFEDARIFIIGNIVFWPDFPGEPVYSIPYGKFAKRLQKRPLGKLKNSDLALWRDHYLSIGRFSVQDVREWLAVWATTVEFAQSDMEWINSMMD